jgi:hypothetical protein
MNIDPHAQSASPADGSTPAPTPALSDEVQSRRRLLLKGLGKGTAVAAVVVPINTLASPTLVRLCTVSGMQSNVGSGRTGINTDQCKGYAPSYYAPNPSEEVRNWPNFVFQKGPQAINQVDGITFSELSLFSEVFGPGATLGSVSLFNILKSNIASEEAIWITALLNAIKKPAGFNFPYTPSQVRAYYNNPDATVRSNALKLFSGYLQVVMS